MTDEERKAKGREKMRRYRLRHKNDPIYKGRVREEKRKQLAKHTPVRRKAAVNARMKRFREKHKNDPAYKSANIAGSRAWREKNPERAAATRKAWSDAHPEVVRRSRQKLLAANPEYDKIKCKEYARTHVEELKAYRKANAARRLANCAARRARRIKAMPPWADKKAIAAIYRLAKAKTKETGTIWHVDHIVPLKHKLVCGLHVPANLQVLPGVENMKKSNRFVADLTVSP